MLAGAPRAVMPRPCPAVSHDHCRYRSPPTSGLATESYFAFHGGNKTNHTFLPLCPLCSPSCCWPGWRPMSQPQQTLMPPPLISDALTSSGAHCPGHPVNMHPEHSLPRQLVCPEDPSATGSPIPFSELTRATSLRLWACSLTHMGLPPHRHRTHYCQGHDKLHAANFCRVVLTGQP